MKDDNKEDQIYIPDSPYVIGCGSYTLIDKILYGSLLLLIIGYWALLIVVVLKCLKAL